MPVYLNPSNTLYEMAYNSEIFVDKSSFIEHTNSMLNKESKYICVTRPRRFGKTTDANMLTAYYSKKADSKVMFDTLEISKEDSYLTHLNKHNVIHLNMQDFLHYESSVEDMIQELTEMVLSDLKEEYPKCTDEDFLLDAFNNIFVSTKNQFIFIIDEWDCILRNRPNDLEGQKLYSKFLTGLLKDSCYVELVYMTGILPIKKFGLHGYLNMFYEYSMTNPHPYEEFMGFTKKQVKDLCQTYNYPYERVNEWYGGYKLLNETSLFNPFSVSRALFYQQFKPYWTNTETFTALQKYIDMDFDGLKEAILRLLYKEEIYVNTNCFRNDMVSLENKNQVLTLLIHLGYLSYNEEERTCCIPNKDAETSFITSVQSLNWDYISKF